MVQQCGAKCRMSAAKLAKSPDELIKLLRRNRCRRPVVPGRNRCHLHGGYSTGPRSAEAKAEMSKRTAAARAGKPRNPKTATGRYTLQAKLARAAVTLRITAAVDARHEARGLNIAAD
jgi:hypothetical protein